MRGKPVREPVQYVTNDCAGGRRYDADRPWQRRQLLLAVRREKAFCGQPCLQLFEQKHHCAFACNLKAFDDDLVIGATGIRRELARGDNLKPVLWRERKPRSAAFPHHCIKPRIVILHAEIDMP